MDDNEYIQGLNEGNETIFRSIFEMFHPRIFFFASQLLGGDVNSDDVVQDAFVKLWEKRTEFESLTSIKSFLYIVVKNSCFNIIKHNKVVSNKKDLVADEFNKNEVAVIIEAEVFEKLFQALSNLPEGCQRVMQLGYFKKMKNKEIAEYLKISINTVKTQKKRGLQMLRLMMKSYMLLIFIYFF